MTFPCYVCWKKHLKHTGVFIALIHAPNKGYPIGNFQDLLYWEHYDHHSPYYILEYSLLDDYDSYSLFGYKDLLKVYCDLYNYYKFNLQTLPLSERLKEELQRRLSGKNTKHAVKSV